MPVALITKFTNVGLEAFQVAISSFERKLHSNREAAAVSTENYIVQ